VTRAVVEAVAVILAWTAVFLILSMMCGTTITPTAAERLQPVRKSAFPS